MIKKTQDQYYILPNGLKIKHLNDQETSFVYKEIFEEEVYLKNGISLNDEDCIFDVGANIGMFSLHLQHNYKNLKIFAFEPTPQLCEIIKHNLSLFPSDVTVLQKGVSNKNEDATFTYYPNYSILSGFNADPEKDQRTIKAGIKTKESSNKLEEDITNAIVSAKLKDKQEFTCRLTTISDIIREYNIEKIDLLKVDAEKSEWEILEGIVDDDWEKIQQMVMEVHETNGPLLEKICDLITTKGFSYQLEDEKHLDNSEIINVYATRNKNLLKEKITIASTFTSEPLLSGLEFWKKELNLDIKVEFAAYNQIFQELLSPQSAINSNNSGINIILLKVDDWLRQLITKNKSTKNNVVVDVLKQSTIDFKKALENYRLNIKLPTLILICPDSLSNLDNSKEISTIINTWEKDLKNISSKSPLLEIHKALDSHKIYQVKEIFDEFKDEIGHVPYTNSYYNILATLIIRRYYNILYPSRKAVILDCDNTLWKGIVGEDGTKGVIIDDFHSNLQQFMVEKAKDGILMCLNSKNNEEDVINVFKENPSMVIKLENIIDSRVNWEPKSQNIHSLAKSLNLGTDSFLFIDDTDLECAEVRENCPDTLTLNLTELKANKRFFDHLWMLDTYNVTLEDKKRLDSYKANSNREKLKESSYNYQEFLNSLDLKVSINQTKEKDIQRIAQLTNRTNQFNFTTIRRTVDEIQKINNSDDYKCYSINVKDRFGDYGLVGVMIASFKQTYCELDTFLLSCRVLGRGVEYKMLAELGKECASKKIDKIKICFRKTAKNIPALNFIQTFTKEKINDANAEQLDFSIESELLSKLIYNPDVETKKSSTTKQLKENHNKVSGSFIRKKEKLFNRIALELSSQKDLEKEIDKTSSSHKDDKTNFSKKETKHTSIIEFVKEIFATSLNLNPLELDENANIEYFMKDSLKIVEITSKLNEEFDEIYPTLLFEHRTLKSISDYILENNKIFDTHSLADDKTNTTNNSFKNNPKTTPVITLQSKQNEASKDIAIVGINGKYPQANNIDIFWENLKNGLHCITEIPADRWNVESFFSRDGSKGKAYNKWGGFINDFDKFDNEFFHISPKEAETMDPQQRIFMEVVWGLLENAGYTPESINRKTGVYIGVIANDYNAYLTEGSILGENYYRNSDFYQIPNRISYHYNFTGPSIAVDTACSSSGTALHIACQNIITGNCNTAIVGGINLFLNPSRFLQYSQMKTLAPDNACKAFSNNANGTVMGEGIGAVLLKPLSEAQKDGDYIYAVIKSATINSGGKTNGFTVPNPVAQAELISDALKQANIDARTISYLEAHGTGTPLGDPIEIRGLSMAYKENSKITEHKDDKQYCSIGSVKTNIGHLESGAAISGLMKIIMQMKHKLFAPSLFAETPNQLIPFSNSPFKIQQNLEEWKQPELKLNGLLQKFPRRAGLSSIGAGGVNTHFILEEFENQANNNNSNSPQVFILSARNKENLTSICTEIASYAQNQLTKDLEDNIYTLQDIAYTLQLGRVEMNERLAFIASNINEVIEGLEKYLSGSGTVEIYSGNCCLPELSDTFFEGREGEQYLRILFQDKKLEKLAKLWVKGFNVNWNQMYEDNVQCKKVPLPTYQFTGSSFLLPNFGNMGENKSSSKQLSLVLDSNESTLQQQRFKKTLSEEDIFLSHHIVNNKMVLPAVAYLEMARLSAALSVSEEFLITSIKNIVWPQPILLEKSSKKDLNIIIGIKQDQLYAKAITSESNKNIVNAEWHIEYAPTQNQTNDIKINLNSLFENLSGQVDKKECYSILSKLDYSYNTYYQVIEEVYYNNKEAISLMHCNFPEKGYSKLFLQPSLMDASLQTITVWLKMLSGNQQTAFVPYTIDSVNLYHPLKEKCYAYVKKSNAHTKLDKFDVEIYDETGLLLVSILGYYTREFQYKTETEKLFLRSKWSSNPLKEVKEESEIQNRVLVFASENMTNDNDLFLTNHIIITKGKSYSKNSRNHFTIRDACLEDNLRLLEELTSKNDLPHKIIFSWAENDFDEKNDNDVASFFLLCKAIIEFNIVEKIQFIVLHPSFNGNKSPYHSAIAGMARSIQRENSKFNIKIIELPSTFSASEILNIAINELMFCSANVIEAKYDKAKTRSIKEFEFFNLENITKSSASVIKNDGVYLITGGMGGLGLIFARYLISHYDCNLILTGRSDLSAEKQSVLEKLNSGNRKVVYIKSDISVKPDVKSLIQNIKQDFGKIDGIIHSAGKIHDAFIRNKTKDEFNQVIAPKVNGTILLDSETTSENLDFFIVFSSTSSNIGHIGQADYSYANRFLDDFIMWRAEKRKAGKRAGKSLAINWPWWKTGGMALDSQTQEQLFNTYGLKGLDEQTGLSIFEQGLNSDLDNFMVIIGNRNKVSGLFNHNEILIESNPPTTKSINSSSNTDKVNDQLKTNIKIIINDLLKIDPENIQFEKNMSEYGFDSVSFTSFADKLNTKYGLNLSPANFYEYQTINSLVNYLIHSFPENIVPEQKEVTEEKTNIISTEIKSRDIISKENTSLLYSKATLSISESKQTTSNEPIAIIGIDCRMPGSDNPEMFWKHLINGDDLVTEIPKERWNWKDFYGNPELEPGKTNRIKGAFINDVDKFDASFFSISPREAEMMDPKQRLFLETAWKAIEDAGYDATSLRGSNTGVFVGVGLPDYSELITHNDIPVHPYISTGNSNAILANRISYYFDFHGPSEPIDTACSSSLVAIHHGIHALRSGQSDMVIAGGVNIILTPTANISFGKAGMLSEDGKCRTFDEKASGYVRGEGVGAIILKPLNKAILDKDHIYAVIKETATNHGGHVSSLTAPNPNAQSDLIIETIKKSNIDPSVLSYIETHGTGTSLGDPIEINGLKKAFSSLISENSFKNKIDLGSVKTNIGHLEAAAGIAGMIKLILSLQHKTIPPTIHFDSLNPNISFDNSPFQVATQNKNWKRSLNEKREIPRTAAISSFGFGGSNAHLILEEFNISDKRKVQNNKTYLFVLSAKNESRLKIYASHIKDYLLRNEDKLIPEEIAYTLQTGRTGMNSRLAIPFISNTSLIEKLTDYLENNNSSEEIYTGKTKQKDSSKPESPTEFEDINAIAKAWCNGAIINWYEIYDQQTPFKCSLPTYPFAKDKYWISEETQYVLKEVNTTKKSLHPLVDENISSIYDIIFTKKLKNINDFILSDYNQKNLSPLSCIEIARFAGASAGLDKVVEIRDIEWTNQEIDVNIYSKIDILLFPENNGIAYEIVSDATTDCPDIFNTGKLILSNHQRTVYQPDQVPINEEFSQQISGADFYRKHSSDNYDLKWPGNIVEIKWNDNEALVNFNHAQNSYTELEIDSMLIHQCIMISLFKIHNITNTTDLHSHIISIKEIILKGPMPVKGTVCCRCDNMFPSNGHNIYSFALRISDQENNIVITIDDLKLRLIRPDNQLYKNRLSKDLVIDVFKKVKNREISIDEAKRILRN